MKAYVEDLLENFKPGEILTRDEDVLDTWFSSALWPFSTLGWPKETPELDKYYQTDVLVTGFDIIFFWVARMMMMGLHFMKDADGTPVEPFHTVYVHALVRDKNGQKMSKSKGNVIDPLELIDEYGADALRFTLAIMAAQGRDVKLDPARIAGYRNFGTKLWNATRFAEMNGATSSEGFIPEAASLTTNRWILTELSRTIRDVSEAIEDYRFNDAAGTLYRFVWNQFCDWYLELLKPVFNGDDEAAKRESQACTAYVLDETYKLLHPFMPFMTEELWDKTSGPGRERATLLCHAEWPAAFYADDAAADEINWLIDLVSGIRSVRAEMNVPPAAMAPPCGGRGEGANARASRSARFRHKASGEGGEDRTCCCGPARQRADRHRRGDGLPSAWQPHRSRSRETAPGKGDRESRRRAGADPRQAGQREIRCQRQARAGGGRTRAAGRTRRAEGLARHCFVPRFRSGLKVTTRRDHDPRQHCRGFFIAASM